MTLPKWIEEEKDNHPTIFVDPFESDGVIRWTYHAQRNDDAWFTKERLMTSDIPADIAQDIWDKDWLELYRKIHCIGCMEDK